MDVKFSQYIPSVKKNDTFKNNNGISVQNPVLKNGPSRDIFVKNSSPSFGSSFEEDALNFFSLIDNIIDMAITSYCMDIIDEMITRTCVNTFLKELTPMAKEMGRIVPINVSKMTNAVFGNDPYYKKSKKYLDQLFKDADINNTHDLKKFLTIHNNASKKCPEMSESGPEALKIYSKLDTKEDLQNFPEILLYLESEAETSEKEINLDEYPAFIKKLGIKDEREFFNKFYHLKNKFNDFEETKDKIDAISYVKSTYDAKIEILEDIIAKNPDFKSKNAGILYLKAAEIIDAIYDKDSSKAAEKLDKVLGCAIKENKITPKTKNIIHAFEDISTPEKRIDFFEFLSMEDISIEELNELFKEDSILIDDFESVLLNRKSTIESIADFKGIDYEGAKKYYSKYREIFNAAALGSDDAYLQNGIQAAINVIDKFGIKSDKDFINKFAEIFSSPALRHAKKAGAKNKKQQMPKTVKITQAQAKEAIDILNFADKKLILEYEKNKNFPLSEKLKTRKQEFETLLPEIQEFLDENENIIYSGKTPFEIFMDYKKLAKNNEDLKTFFYDIEMFKTTDAKEFSSRFDAYNNFAQYFPDKKTTNMFLAKNGIKLDNSDESLMYRKNCLKILNALYKKGIDKENFEYTDKLLQSNFIKNSKSGLSAFLSKTEKMMDLSDAIRMILNKDIQSLNDIKQLIRLYANDDGEYDKIFEHFANTKDDINLQEYLNFLGKMQTSFVFNGIPIKINNDNISAIDKKYVYPDCRFSQSKAIEFANKMAKNKGGNFIASLDKAFVDKKAHASAYNIASEIANQAAKSDESYQNIIREFHLTHEELGLNENATKADYIYAIVKTLPKDIVDFVNSDEWMKIEGFNDKYPNLRLHAKIRLIDRFILNEEGSGEKIHSKEAIEKLKNALKTVYTTSPAKIYKGGEYKDRFEVCFECAKDEEIKAVFSNSGDMITIVKC